MVEFAYLMENLPLKLITLFALFTGHKSQRLKGISFKHQYVWCLFLDGVHKVYPLNHVELEDDDLEHIDMLEGEVRLVEFDDSYQYSAKIMACSDDKEECLKLKDEYKKQRKRSNRQVVPSDGDIDNDDSPDFHPDPKENSTGDNDSSFELDKLKIKKQRKPKKTKLQQKSKTVKQSKGVLTDVTDTNSHQPKEKSKKIKSETKEAKTKPKPTSCKNDGKKSQIEVMDMQAKELFSAAAHTAEKELQNEPLTISSTQEN